MNQEQVDSFLTLINQLSKFLSNYAHNTTKIRSLLHKNTKFIWSKDHQDEFNNILEYLSNLDKLEPYNPKNNIFVLVDASINRLGFILFQKYSNSRSSILQAGSTSLKLAQVNWYIPELELHAVKYMLKKCNHYTAWSIKPIVIYWQY